MKAEIAPKELQARVETDIAALNANRMRTIALSATRLRKPSAGPSSACARPRRRRARPPLINGGRAAWSYLVASLAILR